MTTRAHQWSEPTPIFDWGYAMGLVVRFEPLQRCTVCGMPRRFDRLNNPCPGAAPQQDSDWNEWVQL